MIDAKEALNKLIEGNKRFAQGKSIHPNLCNELRTSLLKGQKPFAAILSCSDARVPIEIIFDVGLGDLFVVRNAGNILSCGVIGSLEYAVHDLGVKLILILGHGNCGAVKAALNTYKTNQNPIFSKDLSFIFEHIYPSFKELDKNTDEDVFLKEAIKANIHNQVENLLQESSYIAQMINNKEIMLLGAKYCLESGLVELVENEKIWSFYSR